MLEPIEELRGLLRRLDEEPPETVEASDEFLLFQLKVHPVGQALRQRATALVDKLDKMSRQDEAGKKLVERLRREKTAGPKPWSEKHYGKEAMEFLLESHTFYVSVQNEKASMKENADGPSAPEPAWFGHVDEMMLLFKGLVTGCLRESLSKGWATAIQGLMKEEISTTTLRIK